MQGLPLTRFLRRLASIGCLCLLALPAQAQLLGGLPEVRLPPASPLVERLGEPARALQARLDPEVRRLLQRYPQRVALDPAGAAILRSEVIAAPAATLPATCCAGSRRRRKRVSGSPCMRVLA